MMTEMMYLKWVHRFFNPSENSDKGKKKKVDRAIFVSEGKTSEEIMESASQAAGKKKDIVGNMSQKIKKNVDVNEVKVSFQRIKKKKSKDDS